MTTNAKTPADRLAEAVRNLKPWPADKYGMIVCPWCGGIWETTDRVQRHRDGCVYDAIRDALAAYDARKKPTVEEVVQAVRSTYNASWDHTGEQRDDMWRQVARAAMRVMGEEP